MSCWLVLLCNFIQEEYVQTCVHYYCLCQLDQFNAAFVDAYGTRPFLDCLYSKTVSDYNYGQSKLATWTCQRNDHH